MRKLISQEIKTPIKLLFIARTYPPLVGGMERFASDFYRYMREVADAKLIANTIGKKRIVFFFFRVLIYLVFHAREFDLVHFNDAILAPLLVVIRLFSKAKATFTVHGLDIVYKKFGYQKLVVPFLRQADRIFPVSQYTKEQCLRRGIPEHKLRVIPNGLDFSRLLPCPEKISRSLRAKVGADIEDKLILLSLGRLIPRKGHAWFIEEVFLQLPHNYCYIIAGDGPEIERIKNLIKSLNLENRIALLGYVSDEEKACLYQLADLFIMPNIPDENDQEGFGIVLLEAGSYGLPSIASDLEGINDAVIDGISGSLVPARDANRFTAAIENPIENHKSIPEKLKEKFDWKIIRQQYVSAFMNLLSQDGH